MADLGPKRIADFVAPFRVVPGSKVRLPHGFDPAGSRDVSVKVAKQVLREGVELLAEYQARLAAQDMHGVLMVLQAMDAAGKDGTIRHVMSGVNPQGVHFGDAIARTMGGTTFSLFRLFSSLETADESESLFSGSILGNRPLLIATGLSVLTIILATELGFLQRILGTVSLTPDQWAVCLLVSLSLIVVEEGRKLLKIRTGDEPTGVAPAAQAVAA